MFGGSRPGAVPNPGPDAGDVLGRVGRHWGWIMAFPAHSAAAYRKQFRVPPGHTLRS
jgi:hypothetical protein